LRNRQNIHFPIFLRVETGALPKLGIHSFYSQVVLDLVFALTDPDYPIALF